MIDPMNSEVYNAASRQDFIVFLERARLQLLPKVEIYVEPYIEYIAYWLMEVALGRRPRTIFNLPPRHFKSTMITVAFSAWMLGRNPALKFMILSHTQDYAKVHFSSKIRQIVTSAWYQAVFPDFALKSENNTAAEFETTMGGGAYAASMDSPVTGHGAHYIIIDDPLAAKDALSEAVRTQVNINFDVMVASRLDRLDAETAGAIIITAQRLHEDDLCGHLLGKGGGWWNICLPMIAEERVVLPYGSREWVREAGKPLIPTIYTPEHIAELRAQVGAAVYETQYQQKPTPPAGTILDPTDIVVYSQWPTEARRVTLSCDVAQKATANSSYTAAQVFATDGVRHYVLDAWRGRLEFSELLPVISRLIERWRPQDILIEDAASGSALISALKAGGLRVFPITPTKNKIQRLEEQQHVFKAGHLLVPEHAPWRAAYTEELVRCPYGQYMDQVDATTQYLAHMASVVPAFPIHCVVKSKPMLPSEKRAVNLERLMNKQDTNIRSIKRGRRFRGLW
jgi:predicted phage terminase large subunit-like protein